LILNYKNKFTVCSLQFADNTFLRIIKRYRYKLLFGVLIHFILFAIESVLFVTTASSQTGWYKYPGNPVLKQGGAGEWDRKWITSPSVIYDNGIYHMWYRGIVYRQSGDGQIGYATSKDGINWTKYEQNPVIKSQDPEAWESSIYSICVLKIDTTYYMYYDGERKDQPDCYDIGVAFSPDGLRWTRHPEPILITGDSGSWEEYTLQHPSVIYDGNEFFMWYAAGNNTNPAIFNIGYARSVDGILWEKYQKNPVLSIGEKGDWDDLRVWAPCVIFNGKSFEMWYTGYDSKFQQIGYAFSIDGIHWNKYENNPVLTVGEKGSWDYLWIKEPFVFIEDSVCKMYYAGARGGFNIGYATSSAKEAYNWDKDSITDESRIIRVHLFGKYKYIDMEDLESKLTFFTGTELTDAYNDLSLAYGLNNYEKSYECALLAMENAYQLNYPEGKAVALYSIGNTEFIRNNYTAALGKYLAALNILDSIDRHPDKASLQLQIADIHFFSGTYDKALQIYWEVLAEFETLQSLSGERYTLTNIGDLLLEKGDTLRSIEIFKRNMDVAFKSSGQASTFFNLGKAYMYNNLDSSIHYLNKAIDVWSKTNQKLEGQAYLYLALTYMHHGEEFYEMAENSFTKAYELYRGYGRDDRTALLNHIGEFYLITKRYDKAEEYLDEAIYWSKYYMQKDSYWMYDYILDRINRELFLKRNLMEAYHLRFMLDTSLKDQESALVHYLLEMQWKDTLYNEKMTRQVALLQGEYETERAQNQVSMLEQENEVKDLKVQQSRIIIYGMVGFVVIIILMGLILIRQNKLRSEHKLAMLNNRFLRSQMNPHFIFNSLSNILNLMTKNETTTASHFLSKFAGLLRNILENTREDWIPIEKEITTLENYLEMQTLRFPGKFEFTIDLDDNIDPENMNIPPMISQPFVENSIEHGIRHKEGMGHLDIRFSLKDNLIMCEVMDNGVGRDKAMEIELQKVKKHKSLATSITQERLAIMNRKLKKKIELNISDIRSKTNEILGTRVEIGIPYV